MIMEDQVYERKGKNRILSVAKPSEFKNILNTGGEKS